MEGEDAAAAATTTTTTRRLRTRLAKPTHSLREKDEDKEVEEEERQPGPRISSSLKRKANITVENLYLQGNYKDPLPTALETIFESPRPARNQRADSPEVPLLMARRKLKRLCVFGSHYQPTRGKLKQRKERALRMRQLTGVRVPLGKAFSEDDVLAALSCLTEEEASTAYPMQDPEKEALHTTASDTLVENVMNGLSSLQMDCEPSLTTTNQAIEERASILTCPSREQKHKRRSGLVVSPLASTSNDQAQPSLARAKRLKRRSGLVFVDKTSSLSTPTSPQETSGNYPSQPVPSKTARAQRKKQKPSPEADQGTTAPRAPQVRPGNKRTPDSTPTTLGKKQCTPGTSTQAPAPSSGRVKGRGRRRGNRRVSGVKRSLYHHNVPATDSPSTSPTPSNTSSPATIHEIPPLPAPSPTHKRDRSPKLPDPSKLEEGDNEAPIVISAIGSPTSPSSRMAALSIQASPSPLPKPRKVRRRSARLSLGSEGLEETRQTTDNDLPLGTFWMSLSPMERKAAAERAAQSGGDNPPLPPSTISRIKKQSKGRRRSNQFLPIPERMEFEPSTITTAPTFITSSSPPPTLPHPHLEAVKSPLTSHPSSPLCNLTSPTLTSLKGAMTHPADPQAVGDGGRETSSHQGMGKEEMGVSVTISPYCSSESSAPLSPSPRNTAFCEPLEGCVDLLTPSPTPAVTSHTTPAPTITPSPSKPSVALTPSAEPLPCLALTIPTEQHSTTALAPTTNQPSATTLTISADHPSAMAVTPSAKQPSATPFTPTTEQPSATTRTPSAQQPGAMAVIPSTEQPSATALTPATENPHSTLTPSPAQALATHTPSSGRPSATFTPSASTLTPGASLGDNDSNPEEDWDSPIITGLLTNETLIRMGKVYYGSPLSAPSSTKV